VIIWSHAAKWYGPSMARKCLAQETLYRMKGERDVASDSAADG
jgi:hypothetical protein